MMMMIRQRSAFFDVRICHPNTDFYRDMDLNQIYRQHEPDKKRQYASRILEVEQATFTPLVFSATGRMAAEFRRYHSRRYKEGGKLRGYHVLDQGWGVLCVAEISITMLA